MSEFQRTILVVNASSRSGNDLFEQAETKLGVRGLKLSLSNCFESFDEFKRVLAREVTQDTLVIAGGGDGTLCEVANHVVRAGAIMGVLPLGTGNSLARDLEIPADLDDAIDTILNGKTVAIDVGLVEDRIFTNVATIGLTTEIADALSDRLKRKFGKLAYIIALRKALKHLSPFELTIESADRSAKMAALQVVLGNGRFHGGPFLLSPHAKITSGCLRVYAVSTRVRRELLKLLFLLPFGRQGELASVISFSSKSGYVQTDPPIEVIVDGEVLCRTPFHYSTRHSALRVRVHPDYES